MLLHSHCQISGVGIKIYFILFYLLGSNNKLDVNSLSHNFG